jgi:hypothetical protein
MKTYWGVDVYLHALFVRGTRWRWVVSFTPRPLYPQERTLGTHWIGGRVGPAAVLDAVVKRKFPVRILVAIPTELSRISNCWVGRWFKSPQLITNKTPLFIHITGFNFKLMFSSLISFFDFASSLSFLNSLFVRFFLNPLILEALHMAMKLRE